MKINLTSWELTLPRSIRLVLGYSKISPGNTEEERGRKGVRARGPEDMLEKERERENPIHEMAITFTNSLQPWLPAHHMNKIGPISISSWKE